MLRNRQEITIDEMFGVDLREAETKLGKSQFRSLENLVPLGMKALRRKPGSNVVIDQSPYIYIVDNLGNLVVDNDGNPVTLPSGITPIGTAILKLHTFKRVGFAAELLAVVKTTTVDKLYRRSGSSWVFIADITGANGAKYDMVTWQGKVVITNGISTAPWQYDGSTLAALTGTNMPTKIQHCAVYQERLIFAGGIDNRHRVWFSDPLVSNFQSTSFHDIRVGTGGEISGLGVNSITTSDQGAQNQLVVLKTDAVVSIHGELGSGTEILTVRSSDIGCPSHKTIANSKRGLVFGGNDSVYLLDQSSGEPIDIGAELGGDEFTTSGNLASATGKIFDDFYHLSIAAPGQTTNSREWMLNLNPHVFNESQAAGNHRWYGPHTGDVISDYAVIDNQLMASQEGSTTLWRLMVPGNNVSMVNPFKARTARLVTLRMLSPDMKKLLFDGLGVMASAGRVTIIADISGIRDLRQTSQTSTSIAMTWDLSQWDTAVWDASGSSIMPRIVRPRRQGTSIQVTVEHHFNEDCEIHGLWLRYKPIRRQQRGV